MADTNYQSYHVVGNREDLLGLIQQVSRSTAPVSSRLSTGPKATNRLHEWQTDALATPTINAAIEGANFSQGTLTPTTRLGNWTQILRKDIKVSGSQADAFNHAGADNEYSYQKAKAMREITRDEEMSLLHATGNSGDSGTARVMKGIMQQITTNVDTGTATTNSTVLTEARFNSELQTVYSAGAGQPDLVVVDPFNKRQISAFTAGTTTQRVGQADEKKLVNAVDTLTKLGYVKLSQMLETPKAFCTNSDYGTIESVVVKIKRILQWAISRKDSPGLRASSMEKALSRYSATPNPMPAYA